MSVVNLQFLRLGLVNHTTLGKTFQKENKDINILIGMVASGCEILICLISLLLSVKLNYDAKNNIFKNKKKEGAFFVQIVSDKDIVMIPSKKINRKHRNSGLNHIINQKTLATLKSSKKSFICDQV